MPDPQADILLLGAGNMGGALLRGWLETPSLTGSLRFHVLEPGPAPWLEEAAAGNRVRLNPDIGGFARTPPALTVIAVKPQILDEAVAPLRPLAAAGGTMVSIAAGRSIAALHKALETPGPLIRVMPNTPMAIGRGVSVCVATPDVTGPARDLCTELMEAGGPVFWIEDERLMDAVTAVSGSGPAYVFHMAECLTAAGIEAGLPADLARALGRLTVAGAGALLWPEDADPEALRKAVTSPGGTTAAALDVLQKGEGGTMPLGRIMTAAVAAAARRARELDD